MGGSLFCKERTIGYWLGIWNLDQWFTINQKVCFDLESRFSNTNQRTYPEPSNFNSFVLIFFFFSFEAQHQTWPIQALKGACSKFHMHTTGFETQDLFWGPRGQECSIRVSHHLWRLILNFLKTWNIWFFDFFNFQKPWTRGSFKINELPLSWIWKDHQCQVFQPDFVVY